MKEENVNVGKASASDWENDIWPDVEAMSKWFKENYGKGMEQWTPCPERPNAQTTDGTCRERT